jgi:dTDP-4-amino-4,6-dideoxygalactose transaminase
MTTTTTRVPFFQHDLGQAELESIARVFEGPILTTGDFVAEFERKFATYLGRRHTVAVTSCTGALHLSLIGLGVGPGDEVITTPMTFVATSTAIIEAGARPVFVDVEPETGNLDAERIEAAITPRTRAILLVHLYGLMCDMRRIREIADRHGLFVVEDAAHCVEGERDGVRPGALSHAACFSFYATKNLASGEGGAVVTDDDALAARVRLLRHHGVAKSAADREREGYQHWDMPAFGWKYNMDNIHAAILLPQFDRLDAKWQRRDHLAALYDQELRDVEGVRLPAAAPRGRHARHLFTVWVEPERRDRVLTRLIDSGVGAVVNYRAIHLLTYFAETLGHARGAFPVAERIGDSTISLPFYPTMPEEHVHLVVARLRAALAA